MGRKISIRTVDCLVGMRKLPARSVDLIFTSPPFKDVDGFSPELMQAVAQQAFRVLGNDRVMFLNFGHLAGHKRRPFDVAGMFEEAGFVWVDTITWVKNHFKPLQHAKRPNNLSEFIFLLAKGKGYQLDRLSVGIPYVDSSNADRWMAAGGKNLKCRGNVWYIPYETIQHKSQKRHKDRFPLGLPETGIGLAGLFRGATVLDPFIGGGTTAVAALHAGMNCIGFDMNHTCVADAKSWVRSEVAALKKRAG